MPYTMNNLQAGIDQIRQGEYVDFEVPAAYHAIIETQDLGNDWNVFINNALTALLNAMFEKLSFDDVKDYIEHENELPRRKRTGYPFEENSFSYRRKRRGIQPKEIQHPPHNQNQFAPADITNMLDDCEVYGQRRDIKVKRTGAPFYLSYPKCR